MERGRALGLQGCGRADKFSTVDSAILVKAIVHITKQPNLKMKTRPKQLLGSPGFSHAPRLYACKGEHTLFTGQRERKREREREREGERETERERGREIIYF
jgi:hypothetical protein